ncbi:hypothetical protein D3C71_1902290 [compost metagenome]
MAADRGGGTGADLADRAAAHSGAHRSAEAGLGRILGRSERSGRRLRLEADAARRRHYGAAEHGIRRDGSLGGHQIQISRQGTAYHAD